jgi:dephospho-CoA kinase
MKVIIINGSSRVGKDNFANFFKKNYVNCVNWSTIDKIKKVSKRNFNWDGKKTDDARKFLSEMKRIWSEYNNGPFNDMVQKINKHNLKLNKKDRKKFIYFVHCREPQEIQKFVDKYGDDCKTVLLKRNDREVPNNESDKNVNNFNYHFIIENSGNKKELKEKCLSFLNEIKNN